MFASLHSVSWIPQELEIDVVEDDDDRREAAEDLEAEEEMSIGSSHVIVSEPCWGVEFPYVRAQSKTSR